MRRAVPRCACPGSRQVTAGPLFVDGRERLGQASLLGRGPRPWATRSDDGRHLSGAGHVDMGRRLALRCRLLGLRRFRHRPPLRRCGIWGVIAVVFNNGDATLLGQLTGFVGIFAWVFVAALIVWLILQAPSASASRKKTRQPAWTSPRPASKPTRSSRRQVDPASKAPAARWRCCPFKPAANVAGFLFVLVLSWG